MTTFTLAELVKPVTRQEAEASIYEALGILGINTTSWERGGVPRVIIIGVSVVFAGFSELISLTAKSGFLELAEGDWLTHLAHHMYRIDRFEATYASGFVQLASTGGGEYQLDPGDLIFKNATTGATYRNLEPVTLSPNAATVSAAILATEPGSASTSNAGTITELVTSLIGVTCTNPSAVVGRDQEKDPALRARCSEMLGGSSPMGPWDAYSSAVRNATRPDGSSLGITRIRTAKDGYGNVMTYVATAAGEAPPSDLEIAAAAIEQRAVPVGVTSILASADALPITIVGAVWMYNDGPDPLEAETAIATALRDFVTSRPIGGDKPGGGGDTGFVFVSALGSAIGNATPEIFRVDVIEPPVDVELEPTQVATFAAAPTITIRQVTRPGAAPDLTV